jgi:hypothetical protein
MSKLTDVSKLASGMTSGLNLRDKLSTAQQSISNSVKAGVSNIAAAASAGGVRFARLGPHHDFNP